MKKSLILSLVAASMMLMASPAVFAQDTATASSPEIVASSDVPAADSVKEQSAFWSAFTGGGVIGMLLWIALFSVGGFYIYLVVQLGILIRPDKIIPQPLISGVDAAMQEGDVVKALQICENDPTPMANILSAAFSHVEEGYDIIQEAIGTAADLEIERLNQRMAWLSVNANISPMIGLLGTVQGMIAAFGNIGGGVMDIGVLAMTISFSLWTTAAGLVVAIPSVCTYYAFRNKANRIVLRMEALTMEIVKGLRNVEVVAD